MSKEIVGFILAAGCSKRLKELTIDKPKSFLEINKKRLIDYHLDYLAEFGIKEACLVVGFLKDLFKENIGHDHKGVKINYIENDLYETTGHSYSVLLGKELFLEKDILLIHADVFYDRSILEMLIKESLDNVVLVDDHYKVLTGDEFVVTGMDNLVSGIGPNKTANIQGEFLGLSKLSSNFMTEFCDYMEGFFSVRGNKFNYEIVMDEFLGTSSSPLYYKKIGRSRWINLNYKEDYEEAKRIAVENYSFFKK
ncbi:phosphocholine cytidylyltransferase family protein [Candidatus Woesearchaeota archaeon]|nr:phosphocholine cytidylyltransferase family protein [Candidatus Woesearchaeota archaeon]